MWWFNLRRTARLVALLALAGLTAGCFQPLYGDKTVDGGPGIVDRMSSVNVLPVDAPNGTRLARVGVEVRNNLLFGLTGGGDAAASQLQARRQAHLQSVAGDRRHQHRAPGHPGLRHRRNLHADRSAHRQDSDHGQTFSRVSYDIPGQQQRFAGDRGLRDAENRAAKSIAENIRSRLASYFVAGT